MSNRRPQLARVLPPMFAALLAASAAAPSRANLLFAGSDEVAGKCVNAASIGASPRTGSPYLGTEEPLVVVNLFVDFQCPVCRRSADPVKQLVADFPGKVKVVFRNNALEMHPRARTAALAASAARRQGRFWDYHDRLFADGSSLDDSSLFHYAAQLGLDLKRFREDMDDPKEAKRVAEESNWARELDAEGTPSFFVNGIRQVGWASYVGMRHSVAEEIEVVEKRIASGVPRARAVEERVRETAAKNAADGAPKIDTDLWASILLSD